MEVQIQQWLTSNNTTISQPTSISSPSSSTTTSTSPETQYNSSTNYEDIKSFTSQNSFRISNAQISCLSIHNNDTLYAASVNEINVLDLKNQTLVDTFSCSKSPSGAVKSIVFRDSKLFTGHQDCKIRVWKITIAPRKHQLISTLPSIKECLLKCIQPKNYIRTRRHKRKLWIEHVDTISGLAVNNDSMYSISWDKSFKIWKFSNLSCLESVNVAHEDAINAIVVSIDGIVYTASADGVIKAWKKENYEKNHRLLTSLNNRSSNVNALALNNDGTLLFSGGSDRNIFVWERDDESGDHMVFRWLLKGHTNAILCLTCVDDDVLISGSSDRDIRVWKRGVDCGYCCMVVLEGHAKPVRCLVAVSDGDENGIVSIFSGSLDGEIKVWKLEVSTLGNSV